MQNLKTRFPVLLILIFLIAISALPAQHQHPGEGHSAMEGATTPTAEVNLAKEAQESKDFSEFNHRMAGFFVLLVGMVLLAEKPLTRRWPLAKYAWPAFLFLPGLYLLFLSDPESWPIGQQSLGYVITVNHQVFQHKLFSLILLALGIFEFQRLRGQIKGAWSAFVFPALALGGSVLLLFHPHPPGLLHTPEHVAAMKHIHTQHMRFAAVGALEIALDEPKPRSQADQRQREARDQDLLHSEVPPASR